jgi:hypothetical protein
MGLTLSFWVLMAEIDLDYDVWLTKKHRFCVERERKKKKNIEHNALISIGFCLSVVMIDCVACALPFTTSHAKIVVLP